ncbi:hypothetical protein [uncultured Methylobacterium sp.]|uniref:hypothetical protein n=1 Tax=uncultured Methylobacterium sp. TaxID=157278 RepID=UPI0035CA43B0
MTRQNGTAADEPDQPMERLAEICIEAHGLIERAGTPEMKAAIEALLVRVGFGLAERLEAERAPA